MNKRTGLLLLVASCSLILVAIILTSLIDARKSNQRVDIRAKAGTESMEFIGTYNSFDAVNNIVVVDNVKFNESDSKPMGTWNVLAPSEFNQSKFSAGKRITITAKPSSFQIATHEIKAIQIR